MMSLYFLLPLGEGTSITALFGGAARHDSKNMVMRDSGEEMMCLGDEVRYTEDNGKKVISDAEIISSTIMMLSNTITVNW